MVLTVFDVFSVNKSIEKLMEQDIKMSFKNGYELLNLKKELDNIERYTIDRLNKVIDNEHLCNNEMTEQEQMVYVAVMESEVEVTDRKIDFDNIKNNNDITLSLSDIDTISTFFNEKKESSEE